MKPAAILVGLVLLAGCNADERGHVVRLDKGGYKAMADTAISDATRETLRQRTLAQGDGPTRTAIATGMAAMPTGAAAAAGRIAGQKF